MTCGLRQSQFGASPCAHIPAADTQILLSRAKNLGSLAENLGEMLFKDACKYFEPIAGGCPALIAALPLVVGLVNGSLDIGGSFPLTANAI